MFTFACGSLPATYVDRMGSSYRIGRFLGIDVRVHLSFGLLVGYVLWTGMAETGSAFVALIRLLFVFGLFAFVVMHEYGHALAARYYGIRTRQITLYPIGGVAMLERMSERPKEQLVIALAGPAVNFVLAAALFALLSITGQPTSFEPTTISGLLGWLMVTNLMMGVFNLLPALPMDGGRVLRALLHMRMAPERATRIAAKVAKVMAGLMALYGLVASSLSLLLIAFFVWAASSAEARAEVLRRGRRPVTGPITGHGYTSTVVGPDGKLVSSPLVIERDGVPTEGQPQRVVARVVDGPDGPRVQFVRQ